MMIGSGYSGNIMNRRGRREALVYGSMLGSVGCFVTLLPNVWTIVFGRILFGMAVGLTTIVAQRFTEETVPLELYEIYAPFNMIGYTLGVLIGFALGYILPSNQDTAALLADSRWHIIYTWFPIGLYVLQVLGLLFVAKHEGVKYLAKQKDSEQELRLAIKQLYTDATTEREVDQIIMHI